MTVSPSAFRRLHTGFAARGPTAILEASLVAALVVFAAALARWLYLDYAADPDLLWRGFYHDRNGHYGFGLDLAVAARHFDVGGFLAVLDRAKVWPPFHGLVLSGVLSIGGIDFRLAIVPSLIGWAATVVLSGMIAYRLFAATVPAIAAGAFAVVLTAGSPAFRLLGSDVMLEGLGAALSALGLWLYLRVQSEPGRESGWRMLALTLTALFFHKGNYWGLLVVALAIAALAQGGGAVLGRLRAALPPFEAWSLARAAVRDPLLWTFAVIAVAIALLHWHGPSDVVLFGQRIRLYAWGNLVTAAYVVLFARAVQVWWRNRAPIEAALSIPGRALFYWHVVPIAFSFLLPRRLSSFLWFVGPSNASTPFDPVHGVQLYWQGFAEGFHAAPGLAVIAIALAALGALGLRHLRPGAGVVFIFVAVCTVGLLIHPHQQQRFLATFVFAVWVAAGAGLGVLLERLFGERLRIVQPIAALAVLAGAAAVNIWQPPSARAYAAAARSVAGPSDLELMRPYLHELDGVRRLGVATTFGMSQLFGWGLQERCRCRVVVENPWIESVATREAARRLMADRIAHSGADTFLVIDAPGSRYAMPKVGWTYPIMAGVVDAMRNQDRYVLYATYPIPSHGAQATIWRRRQGG